MHTHPDFLLLCLVIFVDEYSAHHKHDEASYAYDDGNPCHVNHFDFVVVNGSFLCSQEKKIYDYNVVPVYIFILTGS